MQTTRERTESLNVRNSRQLHVEGSEFVPFGLAGDPDEGGEIERGVVAHVLIVSLHRRVHEKVSNALIDRRRVLESRDKGTDVLECSASNDLGSWI